ncbi:hypothetical protein QOT17_009491 [Balamuthia mandrillaris]
MQGIPAEKLRGRIDVKELLSYKPEECDTVIVEERGLKKYKIEGLFTWDFMRDIRSLGPLQVTQAWLREGY